MIRALTKPIIIALIPFFMQIGPVLGQGESVILTKGNNKFVKLFTPGSFIALRFAHQQILELNGKAIDTANQVEVYGFIDTIVDNYLYLTHVYEEVYFNDDVEVGRKVITNVDVTTTSLKDFLRKIAVDDISLIIIEHVKGQKVGNFMMDIGLFGFFLAPFISVIPKDMSIESETYLRVATPSLGSIGIGLLVRQLFKEKKYQLKPFSGDHIMPWYRSGKLVIEE